VRVTDDPLQITAPEAEAVTCGKLLTVIVTEGAFVLLHPVRVFVPLNVYVADTVAVNEPPLMTDGDHV
jgi:hypothetical protein